MEIEEKLRLKHIELRSLLKKFCKLRDSNSEEIRLLKIENERLKYKIEQKRRKDMKKQNLIEKQNKIIQSIIKSLQC